MENFDFDSYQPQVKIVVIGLGGGGNNAVNRMIDDNIDNVEFVVANTDMQALSASKSNRRFVLGQSITHGLGAGGNPEVGRKAAESSREEIKGLIKDAHMVIIAAGMGGGTGTGSAPVVAKIAKETGALVVAVVTRPFSYEGKTRSDHSVRGLNELKACVDAMIVVNNQKLLINNGDLSISDAFAEADKVLSNSVKTIVDLIMLPALINLDFADIKSVLQHSGIALIGTGSGSGPDKVREAISNATNSPLLETSISGARRMIVSVTAGSQVSLNESMETIARLKEYARNCEDVKSGININPQLTDQIIVNVIASDFEQDTDFETQTASVGLVNDYPEVKVEETKPIEETDLELNPDNFIADFLKD